ncbi:Mannosyl phosphorylinositol ceramide synthase [Wickerhamomyces ciferrii]|uniref:inositol phosphorylceramide mannosyltransferase n=1 Tax=Wickerhamomyces ciferrii (strain ATCC 14091 / BCRC 22168 / CBS 111 / JCM 3599 / NBRC 0793 / NRRL Y-1031 F-60-10) TaxID=1206466 RepID=K0KZ50_WICCF|nr:Mannosyl phosphorylinositol ceramide synthase [Wickerhamomyces ciferrii]CCH46649.1 Mannosyl phosphorylinositol ceramide synthase [Wickerhamomyces ciferrii]
MRKELQFLISVHLFIILFLVYQTFDLITLIYDDTFEDALNSLDLHPKVAKPELIPKIIHQTYKDTNIPSQWQNGQQRCIDLHPDYQYILWTDDMAREFISEEYPWFLETWDNYKYPIQRADSIRYFALSHFGGIYIDLDDACEKKLDPLLTVPAFVRKTIPTGISNDVMGSVPKHPFFLKAIDNLQRFDWNYLIPYVTIMYSTGPLFLSVIWKQYRRWNIIPESGKVRILFPEDYKKHTDSFFSYTEGSSWHLDDAKFIKSLAHHIGLCVFIGFLVAGILLYGEYRLYVWLINGGYKSSFLKKCWNKVFNKNQNIKRNRKNSNLPRAESILLYSKEVEDV